MQGYSGNYGERCGGNVDEAVRFGTMLIKQGVALDPALIETFKLQDMFKPMPVDSSPKPAPLPGLVKISEEEAAQRLVHQEEVVYPSLARAARVQGSNIFEITVDTEGEVMEVSTIRCHPLLCSAAMDALRKYRYTPLLLRGKPRPFKTRVQVRFTLP